MKRRILALLIAAVLILSMTACKSTSDEEESAVSGNITTGDVSGSTPQTNGDSNSTGSDGNTQTPDTNSQTQQPSTDNEQNDSVPDNNDSNTDVSKDPTAKTYTVTLDYGYDSRTDTKEVTDKLSDPGIVRRGYELEGWYYGKQKWDFDKNTVSGNITLTAKWTKLTYTITYNAEGATVPSSNPKSYDVDSNITLEPATMTGKAFEAWSINNGVETVIANSITAGTTGDLVLTPVWDEAAIVLGKYEQDGNTDNGAEPIVWVKIKEENGKALLISRDILDCKQYDKNGGDSIRWASCSLRNWLNNTFYKQAFGTEEREMIVQTQITTAGHYDGSTSNDYVFTLSLEEAGELLKSKAERCATVTKYALANGAQDSPTGGWWWLRTKYSSYGASLVENDGNIRPGGYTCKMETIGVRPVIWVDLSKLA